MGILDGKPNVEELEKRRDVSGLISQKKSPDLRNSLDKLRKTNFAKRVHVAPGIPEKQLRNATASMRVAAGSDVLILVDDSLTKSGKAGICVTSDRICWKKLGTKGSVKYDDVKQFDAKLGFLVTFKINGQEISLDYFSKEEIKPFADFLLDIVTPKRKQAGVMEKAIEPKIERTLSIPELTAKELLTYVDEAIGFSVSYPENWKKMSESVDFLVGFEASEAKYGSRTKYIVTHDELSTLDSVQGYFATIKGALQKRLKEYAPVSEEGLTIDGMPAIKHVYTFSEKGIPLRQMQIYLKQGEVGWAVTFTSTPDAFDSCQPTFETIAASFHLFEASRGEKARFALSAAVMKGDIRGWGIGLIIMGVIQIAVPLLDPVWGGVLIAIGIMELFIQRRILFMANGAVIIIAGIMNMIVAVEEGVHIGGFAILQFIWGVKEILKFFKYRSTARG